MCIIYYSLYKKERCVYNLDRQKIIYLQLHQYLCNRKINCNILQWLFIEGGGNWVAVAGSSV